jgi:hypothetical protein
MLDPVTHRVTSVVVGTVVLTETGTVAPTETGTVAPIETGTEALSGEIAFPGLAATSWALLLVPAGGTGKEARVLGWVHRRVLDRVQVVV